MKIKVQNGKLQVHSLFKPIFVGYVLGMGVLGLPILLALLPVLLFVPVEAGEGASGTAIVLAILVMAPITVAFQAVMLGASAIFGLWVFNSRGTIEIEETND